MTKKKGKEFLKVLAISALSIGLFSAAFVGINTLAFAAATGTESLPPVTASVVIPGERTLPEGFIEPSLTVTAGEVYPSAPRSANALSPDEAAQIGAQYIWQMFGESIDGKYVTLFYSAHPSHIRAIWRGTVSAAPLQAMERATAVEVRIIQAQAWLFDFAIDAVTGEWIDISRLMRTEMPEEVIAALEALSRIGGDDFLGLRSGGPVPENLDGYAQIAKEHAARHFVNTEVVSYEFRGAGATGFGLDTDGNVIATSHQMMFEVTDSTGRAADVAFDEATGELIRIFTQHNDFVPGFRFEDDGRGIG